MSFFYLEVIGADRKTTKAVGASCYDEGVNVRESEGQRRASSAVTLSVLIVIGRFIGTDGLAHEGEVAGQGPDGKYEGLVRVIPRLVCMAIKIE
jgi:hypothetical protein